MASVAERAEQRLELSLATTRKSTKGKEKAGARATAPEVRKLQVLLLKSILTGEPLPGGLPVTFPDIAFVKREPVLYVDDENVQGALSLSGARKVSAEEIREKAETQGEVTYFHFDPPRVSGDEVTLTVHGKIASHKQGTAGLSTVQVKFRKTKDGWEAVGPPTYSAA